MPNGGDNPLFQNGGEILFISRLDRLSPIERKVKSAAETGKGAFGNGSIGIEHQQYDRTLLPLIVSGQNGFAVRADVQDVCRCDKNICVLPGVMTEIADTGRNQPVFRKKLQRFRPNGRRPQAGGDLPAEAIIASRASGVSGLHSSET